MQIVGLITYICIVGFDSDCFSKLSLHNVNKVGRKQFYESKKLFVYMCVYFFVCMSPTNYLSMCMSLSVRDQHAVCAPVRIQLAICVCVCLCLYDFAMPFVYMCLCL